MYKLLSILLFAYCLAITTDEIYDNSYALIIGIDKYENVRSLDYAVKDAEDIQSMLVDNFHFQQDNIVLLKNEEATKTSIIQEFSNITKKAESNDRVLIFFAGHGETMDLPDGGEMGFLLPVDGNKTDLYVSAIKMEELKTISLLSEAKHLLNKRQGKYQMGLNKIILIEEVYDSIAVGKIINNENTCIKLLPGDLLKLNK